jgi:hypothetical protein
MHKLHVNHIRQFLQKYAFLTFIDTWFHLNYKEYVQKDRDLSGSQPAHLVTLQLYGKAFHKYIFYWKPINSL